MADRGRASDAPNNLPHHLTGFINREADLRFLKGALAGSRLVTLTGTGGAGKTRLAAEVTKANLNLWPDGAWWIDLSAAGDVASTVLGILELPGQGQARDVVSSWLRSRRAVLVLDNCEHLVADSAAFAQMALERCPQLTIVATSREPLGVPGEVRWPVASLGKSEAIQLFEARARLVAPTFKVEAPNREPVTQICARLDGLPLAIEMASARLDMMSERELLENLNDRFRVLASGARTGPERQQTMTATIDWSHRLLTEDEGRLFRRLSAFQGGVTMEAAQAVCSADGPGSVLPLLSALVQKSMVVADRLSDDRTRYRLLESHHAFATERLRESGELDATLQRHYDYFSSRKWDPTESANFWHAVSWGRDNSDDGGLGLALEIGDSDFSDQTRAQRLLVDLLEHTQTTDIQRAKALSMVTRLAWRQSDHAATRTLADQAVAAARKVGDPELMARALNGVGLVHEREGDFAQAGREYDEALALLRGSTNRRLVADVSNTRALLAIEQGDPAAALEILNECVSFARAQNDQANLARYLESLANAQLDLGDLDGAAASWNESLSTFRDFDDWFGIIWAMSGLSLVAAARHEDERALRLAAAADRLSRQYSFAVMRFRADQVDAACRQARARLGSKGRGEAAWSHGQAMTTAEGLEYALTGDQPADRTQADAGPLSRREREVVTMVAAGMTNKQIAQRLFIAERTAEGHVERIRNKLGVRSRTEVATWAMEHGLGPRLLDKPPPTSKV
ncbi:MAG: LuxR C-terminal-related transcriptional regulator [Candidatus Dormiibacterota bacterium]